MDYKLTKGEKGKIDLKIDVPKTDFTKVYDDVLAHLSKDAKIAGFRPGHVPGDVVEQHVGLGKILNESASMLISKHLSEILDKEKITPIGSPSIAIQSLAKNQDFSFTVSLYQRPQVSIADWKKIKIKKIKAKNISDDDVDESIKNIFDAYKKQPENKNQIQDEETEDDQDKNGKYIYDAQGNKIFLDGTGKNDDKAKDKKKPFKQPDLAEIDDNFAKNVGARDLAHLKEVVKRDLEQIVADQVEVKFEDELYEQIAKLAEVEVPDILIDDELNRILVRFNTQLEREGLKLDQYLENEKLTLEELKAKWRPQAEKNVKLTLIMDQIGQEEKVAVTKEELENALRGFDQSKMSEEQQVDLRRYVALSLFQAKTLDLVKQTVTINNQAS